MITSMLDEMEKQEAAAKAAEAAAAAAFNAEGEGPVDATEMKELTSSLTDKVNVISEEKDIAANNAAAANGGNSEAATSV